MTTPTNGPTRRIRFRARPAAIVLAVFTGMVAGLLAGAWLWVPRAPSSLAAAWVPPSRSPVPYAVTGALMGLLSLRLTIARTPWPWATVLVFQVAVYACLVVGWLPDALAEPVLLPKLVLGSILLVLAFDALFLLSPLGVTAFVVTLVYQAWMRGLLRAHPELVHPCGSSRWEAYAPPSERDPIPQDDTR